MSTVYAISTVSTVSAVYSAMLPPSLMVYLCTDINYTAFVLFWHQQCGFCFVLISTMLLLFSSCINHMDFFCSGFKQHGFCIVPMSTTWLSNWQQLIRQGEVAWIFIYQGHIRQASQWVVMEWLTMVGLGSKKMVFMLKSIKLMRKVEMSRMWRT